MKEVIASKRPNTVVAHYQIIGTRVHVYRALELTTSPYNLNDPCPYSSVHSVGDAYYGDVDSLRPGKLFGHLKAGSPERTEAIAQWYRSRRELCHQIILEACPELAEKKISYSFGAIEVVEEGGV